MPPKHSAAVTATKDDVRSLFTSANNGSDDAITTRQRLRDQRRQEVQNLYAQMQVVREDRDPARRVICNAYHQQFDVGQKSKEPLVKTLCQGAYYDAKSADHITDLLPHRGVAMRSSTSSAVSGVAPSKPSAAVASTGTDTAAASAVAQTQFSAPTPRAYVPRVLPYPQDDSHDHWGHKIGATRPQTAASSKRSVSSLQRCAAPIPLDDPPRPVSRQPLRAPYAPDEIPKRVSLEEVAAKAALDAKPLVTPLPLPPPQPAEMRDAQTQPVVKKARHGARDASHAEGHHRTDLHHRFDRVAASIRARGERQEDATSDDDDADSDDAKNGATPTHPHGPDGHPHGAQRPARGGADHPFVGRHAAAMTTSKSTKAMRGPNHPPAAPAAGDHYYDPMALDIPRPQSTKAAAAMLPKMGRDQLEHIIAELVGSTKNQEIDEHDKKARNPRFSNRPLDTTRFLF